MASEETKFISVITDEAMQKICYTEGGWDLQPFQWAVSNTDILSGIPIYDDDGDITPEAWEKLTSFTTSDMMADFDIGKWHQQSFSSIIKINTETLKHHVVIPANVSVSSNKDIKVIYFLYSPHADGEAPFLYAIAYAVEDVIYEPGITQSFYFDFTVTNTAYVDTDKTFSVNYIYPNEIADHNTCDVELGEIHDGLVDRQGNRSITGILKYDNDIDITNIPTNALVPKAYVDNIIAKLKADNDLV